MIFNRRNSAVVGEELFKCFKLCIKIVSPYESYVKLTCVNGNGMF